MKRLAPLLLTIPLLLTGCSSGTEDTTDPAPETTDTTSATTTATTELPSEELSPADSDKSTPVFASAPTVGDVITDYQFVETVISGMNIYQEPDTDNYHLCIMYGEAPAYDFITDTGCSEAMGYEELANAIMDPWDETAEELGIPIIERPTDITAPEVVVAPDNADTKEFWDCMDAGGSVATCGD